MCLVTAIMGRAVTVLDFVVTMPDGESFRTSFGTPIGPKSNGPCLKRMVWKCSQTSRG